MTQNYLLGEVHVNTITLKKIFANTSLNSLQNNTQEEKKEMKQMKMVKKIKKQEQKQHKAKGLEELSRWNAGRAASPLGHTEGKGP